MKGYIVKRVLISLFMLFILSALIYFLIRLMPGDYVKNTIVGNPKITEEMKNGLIASYGLNQGLLAGYFKWITSALSGNFGISFLYQIPVMSVIGKTIGVTLALSLLAFVFELFISIVLGMTAAIHQNKSIDHFINFLSIIGISLPSFFVAVILQKFFAAQIPLFPISGLVSVRAEDTGIFYILDVLWHFCLPIAVLVITGVGSYTKFIRTNTLQVLNADYILAARAKGLSNKQVILRHVFPNTLVPLISIVSTNIPTLFTRTLIVEQIFSINGLGYTAFSALKMSDTPLIMGFTMLLSVITVFSILLTDLVYGIVDPRIRIGKGWSK